MNIDKKIISTLSASGACKLRKDLRKLKRINSLQGKQFVIIDKRIRAALFPWSINKVKMVLPEKWVPSLNEGVNQIIGVSVPIGIINTLFSQSSIYKRLAQLDYPKAPYKAVQKRLNKIENDEKLQKVSPIRRVDKP